MENRNPYYHYRASSGHTRHHLSPSNVDNRGTLDQAGTDSTTNTTRSRNSLPHSVPAQHNPPTSLPPNYNSSTHTRFSLAETPETFPNPFIPPVGGFFQEFDQGHDNIPNGSTYTYENYTHNQEYSGMPPSAPAPSPVPAPVPAAQGIPAQPAHQMIGQRGPNTNHGNPAIQLAPTFDSPEPNIYTSHQGLRSPGADSDSASGNPTRPAGLQHISTSNACVECRRRKTRCDGTQPCSQCQWYQHPEACRYSKPVQRGNEHYQQGIPEKAITAGGRGSYDIPLHLSTSFTTPDRAFPHPRTRRGDEHYQQGIPEKAITPRARGSYDIPSHLSSSFTTPDRASQHSRTQPGRTQPERSHSERAHPERSDNQRPRTERSHTERSHMERSHAERSHAERSNVERSNAERSRTERARPQQSYPDWPRYEQFHPERIHLEIPPGVTNYQTSTQNQDQIQIQNQDQQQGQGAATQQLKCPHCDQRFKGIWAPGNLSRHIREKHADPDPNVYFCDAEDNCNAKFSRKDALLKHQRDKHPELKLAPPVSRKQ